MKCSFQGNRFEHWHKVAVLLLLYDIVAVNVAYFAALWVRYDCTFSAIPGEKLLQFLKHIPVYSVVCIVAFLWLRLYNSIWRFASFNELLRVLTATAVTAVAHVLGMHFIFGHMPSAYYIMGTGIQLILLVGIRFSYRFVLLQRSRSKRAASIKRVMLVGAGNAGQMILRDTNRLVNENIRICCLIDDNPNKWGRYIEGVPVIGGRDDILAGVRKYEIDKIFVAVPSASDEDKRDILNICKETGCELKNLPGIYQLVSGQVSVGDMKDVAVEDLLGRKPIQVDMEQIYRHISDKTILVTGGGGSIVSELCRQVADHNP